MALSKSSAAITQLAASGTSTTVSVSAGIATVVAFRHDNGTGTVTAPGTAQVQFQVVGAARWYTEPTLLVTFSGVASVVEDRCVLVPDAATAVRVVYTVPTGVSSPTLDAEVGYVTP